MKNSPNETLLSSSDNANGIAPERNLPTPHFDEISIQNARPAVPLAEVKSRRFWPLALILMCASSLVGGVLALALLRYENRSPAASVAPEGSRVSTGSGPGSLRGQPAWGDGSDRIVKPSQKESERLPQSVGADEAKANDGSRPAEEKIEQTRAALPRENSETEGETINDPHGAEARAMLQGALDEWISATNARDIQRQMNFYNQTVNAFYRTRNVPREAVRAEKSRVLGRADVINIKAAAPGIRLSRDGRTATMRFRKKYAIEGGGEDRRGEVVQELRWQRTDDGWKIVSERDLRVIN